MDMYVLDAVGFAGICTLIHDGDEHPVKDILSQRYEKGVYFITTDVALLAGYTILKGYNIPSLLDIADEVANAFFSKRLKYANYHLYQFDDVKKILQYADAIKRLNRPYPAHVQVTVFLRKHVYDAALIIGEKRDIYLDMGENPDLLFPTKKPTE